MPIKSIFSDIFDYGDRGNIKKKNPALSGVLPSLVDRSKTGEFNVAELNRRAEGIKGGQKTRTARTASASTFMPAELARRMEATTIFENPAGRGPGVGADPVSVPGEEGSGIGDGETNFDAIQADWEGINADIEGDSGGAPGPDLGKEGSDMFGDQIGGTIAGQLGTIAGLNLAGGLAMGLGTDAIGPALGSAIKGMFGPLGLLNIANTGIGTSMAIDEAKEAAGMFPEEQQTDVMQGVFQTQPKTAIGQLTGSLGLTDPGLTAEDTENLRSDSGYDSSFGRDAASLTEQGINPDQIFGDQSYQTVDMGLNEMDIEGMNRQGVQIDLNQGIRDYNEPSFLEEAGFVKPDQETIDFHTTDPVERGEFSKLDVTSTPEQERISELETEIARNEAIVASANARASRMSSKQMDNQGNPMQSLAVKRAKQKISSIRNELGLGSGNVQSGYSTAQRSRGGEGGWSDYSGSRGTRGGFGDVSKGGYGGMGGI